MGNREGGRYTITNTSDNQNQSNGEIELVEEVVEQVSLLDDVGETFSSIAQANRVKEEEWEYLRVKLSIPNLRLPKTPKMVSLQERTHLLQNSSTTETIWA